MEGGELRCDKVFLRAAIAKPGFCRDGNFDASFKRGSQNVPLPAISRFATNAFQWAIPPHPVYVCWLLPARPKAGGSKVAADFPSGRKAFPSRINSASNFPGPQFISTLRTVGSSAPSRSAKGLTVGAEAMIAPTFRSRAGQPSSRFPIIPAGIEAVEKD
jgi:hypothetical protein